MKTNHLLVVLCLALASSLQAQTIAPAPAPQSGVRAANSIGYSIIERGANHRKWAKVTRETNSVGRITVRTNSFTQLASGLHYRGAGGQWQETQELIELLPDGAGAAATNGPRQVFFPPDLYDGAIQIAGGDGRRLTARPYAICYSDGASTVVIANLTNSVGLLLPSGNHVSYTNTFSGLQADIVCSYWRRGFECDLVFRERPPSPSEYGLDPAKTRIQLLTEFLNPAEPTLRTSVTDAVDQLADTTLDFGALRLGRGRAFYVGTSGGESRQVSRVTQMRSSMPVYKRWERVLDKSTRETRSFLVEEVPYLRLEAQLDHLAAIQPRQQLLAARRQGASIAQLLTSSRPVTKSTRKMELAGVQRDNPGVVLDYTVLDWNGFTNFTFQADTTYLVEQAYFTGTTTIEGGTVIKYDLDGGLHFEGPIVCKTSPYHCATFTMWTDHSIGEDLNNGAGDPVAGDSELFITYDPAEPLVLSNVRFAYAATGLFYPAKAELWNCQFVNCVTPVLMAATTNCLALHNVLLTGPSAIGLVCFPNWSISGEHVTADVTTLVQYWDSYLGSVFLTNSIITGSVMNSGSPAPVVFTNQVVVGAPASTFQTVGAGAYYLADNSPYRNAGTTNISAALQTELRQLTTYPPLVYSNIFISAATSLGPQAQRDTDAPDLAYHYPALDYALCGFWVTNTTVELEPGTAVATFGQHGIALFAGSQLSSKGLATNRNQIARYNLVQEGSTTNWNGKGDSVRGDWWIGGTPSQIACRFTAWSMPAQDDYLVCNDTYGLVASFSDCQFHGGKLYFDFAEVGLTNCFLERVYTDLEEWAGPMAVSMRNSLAFGGHFSLGHWYEGSWIFRDNVFDRMTIDQWYGEVEGAYNAYITNCDRLMPTNVADQVVSGFNWQSGWLGDYYLPYDSPLIDAGSTTADAVGLYQYTTQTTQDKEAGSAVDIGLHYVAVDGNGHPVDSDWDGTPDYLEDLNGNGSVDSGETDWQSGTDPGLKVWITEPRRTGGLP